MYVPAYRRTFCVWTVEARGRPERPGLGLGLEAGGAGCAGMALRVPSRTFLESLQALWAREMLTGVYRPRWLPAQEDEGGERTVLAFVAERRHPQYAAGLGEDERAACIASARGELGSCREYLENSVHALQAAGIRDPGLEAMMDRVRALAGDGRRGGGDAAGLSRHAPAD